MNDLHFYNPQSSPKIKENNIYITLHLIAGKPVNNHKGRNRHFTNPEELEAASKKEKNKGYVMKIGQQMS